MSHIIFYTVFTALWLLGSDRVTAAIAAAARKVRGFFHTPKFVSEGGSWDEFEAWLAADENDADWGEFLDAWHLAEVEAEAQAAREAEYRADYLARMGYGPTNLPA